MFTRLRKFSSSVFLYAWFWLAQPPIGFGLFLCVCVFKSPKKDENWYELPGLKNYEKVGVEYGCLGALGNNRVRLKISQTFAIMPVIPAILHKLDFILFFIHPRGQFRWIYVSGQLSNLGFKTLYSGRDASYTSKRFCLCLNIFLNLSWKCFFLKRHMTFSSIIFVFLFLFLFFIFLFLFYFILLLLLFFYPF